MPEVDFSKRYELWLCDDCMIPEANGDATGLDYHYTPKEATQRLRDIEAGFNALAKQGRIANDYTEEVQRECSDCHLIAREEDFVHFPATDDEDEKYLCPVCHSEDTERRDSGHDEFSWRDCDCCGSDLGGSRTRYALFPFIKEEA